MKDIYGVRYCDYPIGKIVEFGTNVDPNSLYPGTKWSRYAPGQVTVGYNGGDADFNSFGKTGGAKTFNNAHNHDNGDLEAMIGATSNDIGAIGYVASNLHNVDSYGKSTYTVRGSSSSNEAFNHFTRIVGLTGTSQSTTQSLLQPYAVVSRWIRNS